MLQLPLNDTYRELLLWGLFLFLLTAVSPHRIEQIGGIVMSDYTQVLQDVSNEIEQLLNERDEETKKKAERAKRGAKAKSAKKLTKKEQQILELANNTVLPEHYSIVWTEEDLKELTRFLTYEEAIAVDTETMGVNWPTDEIVGISFYAPHRGYYIPLKHIDEDVHCLPKELVANELRPILEDEKKKLLLHNAKFDCHILRHWMNIRIKPYFDTMIAAKLLDENTSAALKDLAPYYHLVDQADKYSTLFGKVTFDRIPIKLDPVTRTGCLAGYYAIKDTELTYKLAQFFAKALERPKLANIKKLMYEVEMPFLHIVTEAEAHGVKLDTDYLENVVAKQLNEEIETLRKKIEQYTGKINLNSPAQLAEALYVKLKLPTVNQNSPKSTDKKTLKKLKGEHEVIGLILEYREKVKLATAFAEKLPKSAVNGRVHTSFMTIGAKTGRMSSSDPNLQQIPAKVGGLIRNAFVADEGRLLASIDFSGQELRVLAHITKDPVLLKIYKNDGDVHSMTAVGMWNRQNPQFKVDYDFFQYCRSMTAHFQDADGNLIEERFTDGALITELVMKGEINTTDPKELRKQAELGIKFEKTRKSAKTVNFGIIYGMSEKGLAETLEITEDEAREYIAGYFDAYPGVKKWMEDMRKFIDKHYYTETMLGRKRRVYPEMRSGEWWLIQRAYRMGINAIIQGSSADMTKLASIKLQPLLKELDARIVLWVHDEIIFDVPENIGMENLQRIADVMCNALPLDCGLKSDIEVGKKWGQKMSKDELDFLMEEVA
jgi:DNA polymerase I